MYDHRVVIMGLFTKKETVFARTGIRVGDVNLQSPTGTGYDNIVTLSFDVDRNVMLRVGITSDRPVDVVIAHEDGSMAAHHEGFTAGTLGPVTTGKNKNMGLILGVYPGDKAVVNVTVWTDRK